MNREAPIARMVREAIETVATPEVRIQILHRALHMAREHEIPQTGAALQGFVDKHLRTAMAFYLGNAAAEAVIDRRMPSAFLVGAILTGFLGLGLLILPILEPAPGTADRDWVRAAQFFLERGAKPSVLLRGSAASERARLAAGQEIRLAGLVCLWDRQGPCANGMPELHKLTPYLGVLQNRGFKVALLTDGRMSGASGKVPAAIHVAPEALDGGPIARVRDGDVLRVIAVNGPAIAHAGIGASAASRPRAAGNWSNVNCRLRLRRAKAGSAGWRPSRVWITGRAPFSRIMNSTRLGAKACSSETSARCNFSMG